MSTARELGERLFVAVQDGDLDGARAALAAGADARYAREESGEWFRVVTPTLFVACAKKHRELVALLLAYGADPNACHTSEDSWHVRDTCLRAAMPSVECVTLLLSHGADPNQPSEEGESTRMPTSALQDAGANAELTELLRRHGADPRSAPRAVAERAREQAAEEKRQRSVKAILAKGPATKRGRR